MVPPPKEFVDQYAILGEGLSPDTPMAELKKAYHEKVREFHPDKRHSVTGFGEKQTQLLNEAWSIFKAPESKELYDNKWRWEREKSQKAKLSVPKGSAAARGSSPSAPSPRSARSASPMPAEGKEDSPTVQRPPQPYASSTPSREEFQRPSPRGAREEKELCFVCHKELSGDILKTNDKKFHRTCCKCHACGKLIDGSMYPKGDKIFCSSACHSEKPAAQTSGGYPIASPASPSTLTPPKPPSSPRPTSSPRGGAKPDVDCTRCGKHISGSAMKASGKYFHKDCYTCKTCNAVLGDKFFPADDDIMCRMCAEEHAARNRTRCSQCKQTVVGKYRKLGDDKVICLRCSPPDECAECGKKLSGKHLDWDGLKFHGECFKCEGCHEVIGDRGVFTSKRHQRRYCEACAKEEQRTINAETLGMCAKCGKVLSGEYVEAEDMKFHSGCFTCDTCGTKIGDSYTVKGKMRFACDRCKK